MFGRRKPRTQSQQLVDELTQSYGHLRMAAAHVAGGTAEQVTPAYDRARVAAARGWNTTRGAFSPLYEQMREGAANARREQEGSASKWPVVVGILVAAGAAAGAAGAMIARRRRVAAQWDEYDPMPTLDDSPYGEGRGSRRPARRSPRARPRWRSASPAQAGKLADSLHEKARPAPPSSDRRRPFAPIAGPEESTSREAAEGPPTS